MKIDVKESSKNPYESDIIETIRQNLVHFFDRPPNYELVHRNVIGMIQNIVTAWDPQMTVDLHTTNGTWHAYSLTWAPGYLYAGQPGPYEYTNGTILPYITQQVKEKNDLYFGPYGDYNTREAWPPKAFYTYNHHPRYIINQFGLRNRMSILSEAFAHERFYQRINTTYTFVNEILDYCNKNAATIIRINKEAENAAIKNVIDNAGKIQKGVRYKMVPTAKPLNHFKTYDYVKILKAPVPVRSTSAIPR